MGKHPIGTRAGDRQKRFRSMSLFRAIVNEHQPLLPPTNSLVLPEQREELAEIIAALRRGEIPEAKDDSEGDPTFLCSIQYKRMATAWPLVLRLLLTVLYCHPKSRTPNAVLSKGL